MERGDLAVSTRPYYVVVLEGVLCRIEPITVERRLRSSKTVGFNILWQDLPMRRLATMKRQFPDVGAEIVTFYSQAVADTVADYLEQANVIPYDAISYHPFDTWVSLLPYQEGLQVVYDSDPDRLDRYGQIGRAVVQGEDFL